MMRDNERGVIGLEFDKKNIYKLFFIRAESSHEPSRPQLKLGSFNYRAGLARAKLARVILARARLARAQVEPELSYEPEFFCAALILCIKYEVSINLILYIISCIEDPNFGDVGHGV
jgi:hypothetical protein